MEELILVDANDRELGLMEKMEAHKQGVLHRAFSVFVFNDHHELLLQRRALGKYHSAGLWTNTCCSHPRAQEDTLLAAERRLKEEMGFETPLYKAFHFTYKAAFENGLIEHEFDHVFVGYYNDVINPAPEEVMDHRYLSFAEIDQWLQAAPDQFTPWFHIAFPRIREWYELQQQNQ